MSAGAKLRRAALPGAVLAMSMLTACASLDLPTTLTLPWAEPVPVDPATQALLDKALLPRAGDYVIGAEDALDITVWRDDTLKANALVRPDGGISFPLVGDIKAAGKTAAQLRDELADKLGKFMPEPVVTVALLRVASYRVYVLGRVNKPGDYALGREVDVLQALTLAGGLTPFAVEDGIRVIRKVDGRSVAIPFRYSQVRRGGDLTQNITLRSGDVLLVP
jgi:polysaccharide export outer membrane protein